MGTSSGKRLEKGGLPEGTAPELSIMGEEASCRARTPSAEESAGTKAQEQEAALSVPGATEPKSSRAWGEEPREGKAGADQSPICLAKSWILQVRGAPEVFRGSLVVHSGSVQRKG